MPADVNDAVYALVKGYGAERLAAKTGTPAGTIYNKANPNDSGHHKPTLADVLIWSQISGDLQIVHALCRTLGGVFVSLHDLERVSDDALLDIVSRWMAEQGAFFEAFHGAFADGEVSREEFESTDLAAKRVISAILELLARIEQLAAAPKRRRP